MADTSFWGYRRENGRVGVRNHVVILPLDDLSNAACEAVANNIKGTLAIPHAYGRLQFGEDLDLHFRTLIGTGSNPNVAAVIVIGIEDGWTKRVVDGIAKTGKPVVGFGIEGDVVSADIVAVGRHADRPAIPAQAIDQAAEAIDADLAAGDDLPKRKIRQLDDAHRCATRASPPASAAVRASISASRAVSWSRRRS